jgi:hypothetical protein
MHKACHFLSIVARLVQALIVNDEVYQAVPSPGSNRHPPLKANSGPQLYSVVSWKSLTLGMFVFSVFQMQKSVQLYSV